ncbi:MAG: Decaprenyl-phosphate phosphoribosyltransferase [Alphaproteobacteria bacterium MarineAlpha3_Bin7]|nr:MAG: Decaprenyl-phosphate phosphoribosyltransferase [Alphaproteobacteria bacterium MarineAlpha3_Bin7]|tara:strand:+ start:2017 stop:2886 length:870 start_codon:yes stop_codon:yes gene_type:complete
MKSLNSVVKLIRPIQWVKNLFLGAPIFFTPSAMSIENIVNVIIGFFCFSLLASSIYVFNDVLDKDSDVFHPIKKSRPIANGEISKEFAIALAIVLFATSIFISYKISISFFYWSVLYGTMMLFYSWLFKQFAPIDIIVITLGFVIRVEAGAAIIDATPTVWLLTLTALIALFLALAKRRDDLIEGINKNHRQSLSGYNLNYLEHCISIVSASILVSYVLYTNDNLAMERLGTSQLYVTIPFVLFGILRYLQILLVYKRPSSPETILISDRWMGGVVLCWLVSVMFILHS